MKKFYLFVMSLLFSTLLFGQQRTSDVQANSQATQSSAKKADVPTTISSNSTYQNLDGKATCVFTGRITATDPLMSKRLFRDATPSTCAVPKSFPGDFTASVNYDTFSIVNDTGSAKCVTIALTVNDGVYIHASAYKGSFNPANLATNYLGDSGSSNTAGETYPFEVTVPAGETLVIVLNTNFPGDVLANDYSLAVSGLNCPPASCVFTTTVTTSHPSMTKRLFRDATPSVCGTPKAFPGDFVQNVNYVTKTIKNNTGTTQCISVSAKTADGAVEAGIHLSAYNNTFVPTNLETNYLGDSGLSATTVAQGFGVTVPNNGTIVLVMNTNAEGNNLTTPMTVTVTGVSCSAILATGEAENSIKSTVVYPNPTDSVLYVKGIQMKSVKVFDATGKLIPVKIENNTINTHKLAKGVYALQITDVEGNIVLERFIKK